MIVLFSHSERKKHMLKIMGKAQASVTQMQAQNEQDECLEETKALLKKVSEYDLAQKRLQITAGEQRQIRKALNRLRSKYLAAGRYSDGIDKIIIQVAKPNTTRHMFW